MHRESISGRGLVDLVISQKAGIYILRESERELESRARFYVRHNLIKPTDGEDIGVIKKGDYLYMSLAVHSVV